MLRLIVTNLMLFKSLTAIRNKLFWYKLHNTISRSCTWSFFNRIGKIVSPKMFQDFVYGQKCYLCVHQYLVLSLIYNFLKYRNFATTMYQHFLIYILEIPKMQYQFYSIRNDVDDGLTSRVRLEIRTLAFVFNESWVLSRF